MGFIRTNRIISAFTNEIDWEKVEQYAADMKQQDLITGSVAFPPILGYYGTYSKGEKPLCNEIEDIYEKIKAGEKVFYVTDGHHRSLAACMAGIYGLETEIDYQYAHCSLPE